MLSARMPFPTVPCSIYVPTFSTDEFGNDVPSYDVEPVETECSYAPGLYLADTRDQFDFADPSGDVSRVTFFLPKALDVASLRGALVEVEVATGRTETYKVEGDPISFMRGATPGDRSWAFVGVVHHG